MPDLMQLFSQAPAAVEIGTIFAGQGGGKYSVVIGDRTHTVQTATSEDLPPGTQVIVNKTDSGRYIIGTPNQLSRTDVVEVIING